MKYFLSRLSEPSTYAGIAAFLSAIAPALATHNPVAIAITAAGALATVIPEKTTA